MKPSSPAISPPRQRMIEDMCMRKLEPKTRTAYIRAVRKLTVFLSLGLSDTCPSCWTGLRVTPA